MELAKLNLATPHLGLAPCPVIKPTVYVAFAQSRMFCF